MIATDAAPREHHPASSQGPRPQRRASMGQAILQTALPSRTPPTTGGDARRPKSSLNRFYGWPETGIPSVASGQSSTTSSRTAAVACISPSAPQLSETPVRQPPRQASAWASARQTVVSRAPGSAVWQCCSSTGSSSPGPPATCARHGRRPGDTRDFLGRRRQPVRDPAGRLLALARLTVSRAAYGLMFWLW